jgi:hypothetical protein
LRSHSSVGGEVSHVEETIEFVATLPAEDRISVVQATYETGLLMTQGASSRATSRKPRFVTN